MANKIIVISEGDAGDIDKILEQLKGDSDVQVEQKEARDFILDVQPQGLALKFLKADGKGTHSKHPWPLPENGKYGEWQEIKGRKGLRACSNAIHSVLPRGNQLKTWISHRLFICQLGGEMGYHEQKLCSERARLIRELSPPTKGNWVDEINQYYTGGGYLDPDASLNQAVYDLLTDEEKSGLVDWSGLSSVRR